MTFIGASALKDLDNKDLRVLVAIERGMIHREYVNIEEIRRIASYSPKKIENILNKCHKMDLIHRWVGHYTGYELTIHGYDALALNALYERKTITSIGREKGVGKEAKVFFVLLTDGTEAIIKLHRVGFTSFHQVKKKRRYTANKRHISELYASRLSAESEIRWIKHANSINLPVPKFIASNRHAIVEELISGIDLSRLKKIDNPNEILEDILDFIKKAWQTGKFVHGDLSEHNVIINMEGKAIIIDFPQSVENYAPNARDLLIRDIKNVLTYFTRKYGISKDQKTVEDLILLDDVTSD